MKAFGREETTFFTYSPQPPIFLDKVFQSEVFFLLSLLYFKADRDSFCPPKMVCTLECAALAAYLHMLSAASQRHVLLSVRNRQRCIFWLKGIMAVVSGLDALPPQKILSLFRKYAASEEGLWEMSDALAHSSMGGLRGLIVLHWFMLFHIFHIWMPGIFNPPRSEYLPDLGALKPHLFSSSTAQICV